MSADPLPLRRCTVLLVVALLVALPGAAAADSSTAVAAERRWQAPVDQALDVLRRFDPGPTPYSPGHRGVDLAAPVGSPIRAAGGGVVGYAGPVAGRNVVTVVHGELRTTYEPVTATVRAGDVVSTGTEIGTLDAGHAPCGTCLHWGLRRGKVYLDPMRLLRPPRSRLLPLAGVPPPRVSETQHASRPAQRPRAAGAGAAPPPRSLPGERRLVEVGDAGGATVDRHLPELVKNGGGRSVDLGAEHRQAEKRPPRVGRGFQYGIDVEVLQVEHVDARDFVVVDRQRTGLSHPDHDRRDGVPGPRRVVVEDPQHVLVARFHADLLAEFA